MDAENSRFGDSKHSAQSGGKRGVTNDSYASVASPTSTFGLLHGATPRNLWSALGLLAAGLVFTGFATFYIQANVTGDAQREFDFTCDEIRLNIDARLAACAHILRSCAAFFDASETVEREEWKVFTQGLQVDQHLPGIQGLGFSLLIPAEQLARHVEEIRSQGFPDYQIKPAGERATYSSIIYLEPFDKRNLRAFGYDMYSEPVRRAAMERARDENAAALSGKVVLVQETDEDVQAGTLMYVPVYRHGAPIETVEHRRAALLGWVYSPYRMTDMMNGTLRGWGTKRQDKHVYFQVYDDDGATADDLLYDSRSAEAKTQASTARFTRQIQADFGGRRWTLRFTQLAGRALSLEYGRVWFVLASGTCISSLLSLLWFNLLNTRIKAIQLERMGGILAEGQKIAHLGSWEYEVETQETVWSDEEFRIYGFEPGTQSLAYAVLLKESIHPDDRDLVDATFQACLQNASIFALEHRILRPDGTTRFVSNLAHPYFDASEKVVRYVGTTLDITERKQAEEVLAHSRAELKAIYEHAPVMMCVLDEDRHILFANAAFTAFTGVSEASLKDGRACGVFGCINALDDPRGCGFGLECEHCAVRLALENTAKTGIGHANIEYQATFLRGEVQSEFTLLGSTALIQWFDQPRLLLCLNDITDRKQMEKALRLQGLVLDQIQDHVTVTDLEGVITYVNDAECRSLKYRREDLIGQSVERFGEDSARGASQREIIEQTLAHGEWRGEVVNIASDGSELIMDCRTRIVRDEHEHALAMCGIATDVTERKRVEAENLALERQVQHAQKLESLGLLAGGIAHDFNNILMAILGNADLALDELSPMSPVRDNIQEIEKAAKRAAELAKQMLAYSGRGRFVIEQIDIGKLVGEMAQLLEVSISKKAVLKYNFASNLPAFDGDAVQIRQIIMNLITNASEAVGEKSGFITLSTGAMYCDRAYLDGISEIFRTAWAEPLPEGVYTYFEVADTGCGMDASTMENVFDPFFTTKFMGRGLGMSAVLGIVRGHKGAVKINSEVGKGTTFKVLFPANELPDNGYAVRRPDEAAGKGWRGTGTILIADDEESVCAVGRQILGRVGFNVLTASHGREALETFRAHADDIVCVLLDLTMPHMDGEETFREMRRLRPGVKVLLCSGYNEQEATQRFSGKGLAGFLQKPYSMRALREELRRILEDSEFA